MPVKFFCVRSTSRSCDSCVDGATRSLFGSAVVDETDYDFGRMEVGEEQSHVFTIRNEGEAPLVIVKGPTTCQCTISDVETGTKAPGESAKVTRYS